MQLDEAIKKRASIKRFSTKKVKIEKVIEAIEYANHAPSPGNLPILRYIVIENRETIEKISIACQQAFVRDAHFLVIVCSDSKKSDIMYDERSKKYVSQHAGAAIENFLLKIVELGLVSCWVGAFSDITIRDILNIPDNIEIEAVLPVSYQHELDKHKQKNKPPLDARLFFETWKNTFQNPPVMIRDK